MIPVWTLWVSIPVIFGLVTYLRRPGAGGATGKMLRESDHWAWELAVMDQRRKLNELLENEPELD